MSDKDEFIANLAKAANICRESQVEAPKSIVMTGQMIRSLFKMYPDCFFTEHGHLGIRVGSSKYPFAWEDFVIVKDMKR